MPHRKTSTPRRPTDPLSMKIYSVFLGSMPRIECDRSPAQPDDTPFHELTLGRQLRRAAGHATHAIDEARERLQRTKPKPVHLPATHRPASIVLIGTTAKLRPNRTSAA